MNATIAGGLSARLGPRTGLTASIISAGGLPYTTGLILDLDGDKAGSLGSSVATWVDASGNGNNATQAVMANQPVVMSGSNGHNFVFFNSVNSAMLTPLVLTSPYTIFVVSQTLNPIGSYRILQAIENNRVFSFNRSSAAIYLGLPVTNDTSVVPGTNLALGVLRVGVESKFLVNNLDRTDNPEEVNDWGTVSLGGIGLHFEELANSNVYRICIFNAYLSDSQITLNSNYFNARYGPF